MDITTFIILLFTLQFFYWYIGKRGAKDLNGQSDYFLAGKTVKFFPLMMTFLATQVGGGLVLGASEEAYQFGWPVLLYPLGASLGLILLGLGVGSRLASFKVTTVAEIFEVVYSSPVLKKVASLLSIISLFMILVAQIIASGKFLLSLGFDNTPLFILFWAIVIIYTAQGGLKAVISTDIVQAAFFTFIFLLCFGVAFNPLSLESMGQFEAVSSKLWGWLLMPLMFMVIEQDMGQRCFAGDSAKTVSRATLAAGICTMIVCIVPVYFGTFAKSQGLVAENGGSILMAAIIHTTNPGIAALAGCAILAAIISTATSLINAISSNLSTDFELSFFKNFDPLQIGKLMTCIISATSIFFAFYFDNIVHLLIQSYELSVSCLFIPVAFALYKKKGNFASALLAIIFGSIGFVFFRIFEIPFPREIVSIALSLTGYIIGELAAQMQKTKTMQIG